MRIETCASYWVTIWMSGPIESAKQAIRAMAFPGGMCVTISPELFIYSGGEENGFSVGLRNYPRFPSSPEDLWAQAQKLTTALLDATFQHSAMLVDPNRTEWITRRPQ